jgi:hypothetical protein
LKLHGAAVTVERLKVRMKRGDNLAVLIDGEPALLAAVDVASLSNLPQIT